MIRKYFQFIVVLVTVGFLVLPQPTIASDDCPWTLKLLYTANGNEVSNNSTVKASESTSLKLQVKSANTVACKQWFNKEPIWYRGTYASGSSSGELFAAGPLKEQGSDLVYEQKLGAAPDKSKYTYTVTQGVRDYKTGNFAPVGTDIKTVVVNFDNTAKPLAEITKGTGGGGATEGIGKARDSADALEGAPPINNPSGADDITVIITKLINWMLLILAMVAVIMIIYAGLLLIFNRGDESQISKGKSIITWAIIGLVVSLGAFALVTIIQSVL